MNILFLGAYASASQSAAAYSPYKTAPAANGSSSTSAYSTYPASAPPPHGAYGVPPSGHLPGAMGPPPPPQHVYGPPQTAGMIQRRPEYYPPPQMSHSMHYIPQPQSMPYR